MNIREATALCLLYKACGDATLRSWVATLVPELPECAGELDVPKAKRWIIRATHQQGMGPVRVIYEKCHDAWTVAQLFDIKRQVMEEMTKRQVMEEMTEFHKSELRAVIRVHAELAAE